MKRTFIEKQSEYDEVKTIDTETGEFTLKTIYNEIGFTFGENYETTVFDMGYTSVDDCIKKLKERKHITYEVDYKEQKESERIGLLKLGVFRLNKENIANCNKIKDVCERLVKEHDMNYIDAQEQILAMYENQK